MLIWLCLVAAFLPYSVYGSTVLAFECPEDDDRNIINGTYADPDICGLYYHCNRNLRWPRQCPPGLHYWPIAIAEECTFTMCVEPSDSGCVNTEYADAKFELVREELEAHESEMAEIRKAVEVEDTDYYPCYKDDNDEWVDITLPNKQNCYQYYHCHRGISYPSECPPFSYYTPDIGWRGPAKGCRFQACQDLEDALCSIDGSWGEWASWGECSAPCGDGIQIRERECSDPEADNGGLDCPGFGLEPRLCNDGLCKGNGTAVFVYRLTDIQTGITEQDPIDFEGILVNTDSSFAFNGNTWTAPLDGYYYMGLGAGVLAIQEADAYLKNTNGATNYPTFGVKRSHRNHIGRDGGISNQVIFYVNEGDILNVAAGADTSLTADAGKPSYWTVFGLDDVGGSVNTFSVAFNASSGIPSSPLQYDQILANEGGSYNQNTGVFTPAYSGIYYLTMSAGVDTTSQQTNIDFTMTATGTCDSEKTLQTKLTRSHVTYQGIDTMSRGVLMELNAGCQVQVSSPNAFYSSASLETSFSGFLYNPSFANDRIAFYVARSNSWSDSTALDPLPFDRVVLNEGGGWGAGGLNNYFTAPATGYFYIMVSAGAQSQERVDVRLYKNDEYIADLYRQSVVHQGSDLLARSLIVHLVEGDRLRWRVIANTAVLSSTTGFETSFGGFLLFRGEANEDNLEMSEELLEQFKL